ncbi:agmatine deiminase family protein [Kangiella koreensis]|uniref:Agmatine deiminase n=1 Tax=Kangiella koreensis (strain DSM 16069 / JCM 12317 / KCTC 12182 / SW-125) TaxID=523791 RepID=C7RBA4_KANKD|nr:agmatine deiminase family protein [Kangiella koreensis]ACV26546.1 Agmatine deiminase [Kangiella koreensis DSM 16069]
MTQLKRRWPAEWEAHAATWMAWPCRTEIWTNGLEKAQLAFAEVANTIADYEPLFMLVKPEHKAFATKKLSSSITLVEMTIDDSWTRDTAPIWIAEDGKPLALDFQFNAWGNKFSPFDNDAKVADNIINYSGIQSRQIDMVLEGGAVHSNGQGTILTTKECLLNANRNPSMNQQQIEQVLLEQFGAEQVVWLEKGVAGDVDTDGHIDNIACFVEEDLVISQNCDKQSENFAIYEENRQILRENNLKLVEVSEPEARYEGELRVPLSYINFYIANDAIIMPSFDCKQDDEAKSVLTDLFPHRTIHQINANEILVGGGGIHCITMQQPQI